MRKGAGAGVTVSARLVSCSGTDAVMVATPSRIATTVPSGSTQATWSSLERHATLGSAIARPAASLAFARSDRRFPARTELDRASITNVAITGAATVTRTDAVAPPHSAVTAAMPGT